MLKSILNLFLDLWSPNTKDKILKARRRSLGKFGNLPIEGTVPLDNQKRHLNLLSLQGGGRWEHTLALTNSGAQLQQLQQRHVQKSQDKSSQSDAKNHNVSHQFTSYVIIFAYIWLYLSHLSRLPHISTNHHRSKSLMLEVDDPDETVGSGTTHSTWRCKGQLRDHPRGKKKCKDGKVI